MSPLPAYIFGIFFLLSNLTPVSAEEIERCAERIYTNSDGYHNADVECVPVEAKVSATSTGARVVSPSVSSSGNSSALVSNSIRPTNGHRAALNGPIFKTKDPKRLQDAVKQGTDAADVSAISGDQKSIGSLECVLAPLLGNAPCTK